MSSWIERDDTKRVVSVITSVPSASDWHKSQVLFVADSAKHWQSHKHVWDYNCVATVDCWHKAILDQNCWHQAHKRFIIASLDAINKVRVVWRSWTESAVGHSSVTEREREFMVSVILRVCHLGVSGLVSCSLCPSESLCVIYSGDTTKYTLFTSIPHKIVFVPTYSTFHENF